MGTCETGCREERLDLVRGDAVDWLVGAAGRARERAGRLRTAAQALADSAPAAEREQTAAWETLRREASAALAACPDADGRDPAWSEPADSGAVWWCRACGGVDAPQECLGICTWRAIEWAPAADYADALAIARAERERERRLRGLLRRVAHVRPRPDRLADSRALAAEARELSAR